MKISFGDWRIEALKDLEKLDLPFGQWLKNKKCGENLLHSTRLYNHCYYRVDSNGFSQKVSHCNKKKFRWLFDVRKMAVTMVKTCGHGKATSWELSSLSYWAWLFKAFPALPLPEGRYIFPHNRWRSHHLLINQQKNHLQVASSSLPPG